MNIFTRIKLLLLNIKTPLEDPEVDKRLFDAANSEAQKRYDYFSERVSRFKTYVTINQEQSIVLVKNSHRTIELTALRQLHIVAGETVLKSIKRLTDEISQERRSSYFFMGLIHDIPGTQMPEHKTNVEFMKKFTLLHGEISSLYKDLEESILDTAINTP